MKILQVTTHFNVGGITNYIFNLSRELKNNNADVIVATSGGDMVKPFESEGMRHIKIPLNTKFELHPCVLLSALVIAGIVRREEIDIIHAHSRVSQVASLIASKLTGVPFVTTCHGYFKLRGRKLLDSWGVRVIAISDAVRDHLMRDLRVSADRITMIYNGVDTTKFGKRYSEEEKAALKNKLGINTKYLIGSIGRLSGVKGHEHIINALRELCNTRDDVSALIIGDGEESGRLNSLARALCVHDKIVFLSSVMDTRPYLAIMDVFVFPSIKEGLGIALLEALASRSAAVASRIGGIENIIIDGINGCLVPVGNYKKIAESVEFLLDRDLLRQTMGNKGRQVVEEKFSLSSMAKETLSLYQSLTRRARS